MIENIIIHIAVVIILIDMHAGELFAIHALFLLIYSFISHVITSCVHYIWKRFFRLAKQEYKLAIILHKLTTFYGSRCFFINAEL